METGALLRSALDRFDASFDARIPTPPETDAEWIARTRPELEAAKAAILLLSEAYLASPISRDHEIPKIRSLYEADTLALAVLLVGPNPRESDLEWLNDADFFDRRLTVGGSDDLAQRFIDDLPQFVRASVERRAHARLGQIVRDPSRSAPDHALLMRRRCRVFPGGSQPFVDLLGRLTTEIIIPAKRDELLKTIRALPDFERAMAMAAFYEYEGRIEQMLPELKSVRSRRQRECARRLYCGIANEKLNDVPMALDDFHWVLRNVGPDDSDLTIAATFNANVCLEKDGQLDEVDFARFLEDRSFKFANGEALWLKALSMELIVCAKSGREFSYADLVADALDAERDTVPAGYAKTILNHAAYTGRVLTVEEMEVIAPLESKLTANARGALFFLMSENGRRLGDAELAANFRRKLEQLAKLTQSESVAKYLRLIR